MLGKLPCRAIALTCLGCLAGATAGYGQSQAGWQQVWGGNFPGAANTTYNHNNWWNDVQPNAPWGDGTIQNTSDSLQNVYVDGNGNLVIALTYASGAASPYTSARLTSKYAAGPYGRMDTRIQNPSVQGAGAAFWALGADAYPAATSPATANPSTNGGVVWPGCGELDMMEIQAKTASHNGSTVHGNAGGDAYVSATVDLTPPQTFDNGFHVFTTEWSPYDFQFFLDGTQYGNTNLSDTRVDDIWELNQPINFILSSGIGGNGGTPGTTGFPSNMTVSYVNYSQWSAGAPGPVTSLQATATHSNAVNLAWSASSTTGVTYDIYASTTKGAPLNLSTLVAQNVTATTYNHTGLQPNTTYYYTVVAANFGGESTAATATVTTQAPGNSTGMQLSAGGWAVGTYMNSSFVAGGNTNAHYHVNINTSGVTNPAPQQVYDTERWGSAAWTITGLKPGAGYNVRLHFAENTYGAAGARAFNVSINSAQVLTNFDIVAAAGAQAKAVTQQFYTLADESGIIVLATSNGTTTAAGVDLNPSISGIEIIPATSGTAVGAAPGTTTALSIDSGGPVASNFVADEDFYGGDVAAAAPGPINTSAANAGPQEVYLTQRYTPFTYVIPGLEAGATYDVRMHFAETYLPSAYGPGITGPNQRLFNVNVNGKPALINFDIYAAAGGTNIAVVKDYNAAADRYGQIVVQILQGAAQNPQMNGIEVLLASGAVAAPANLTASSATGAVDLSWTASATAGVSYTIYRGTPGTTPALLTTDTGTTYADTSVASGTTYNYYVVAVKGSGTSAPSNTATVTAGGGGGGGCTVPTVPGTLTAAASSSSQISLNWNASTASCTATYIVYRSTVSGFTASSSTQVASVASGTAYTDTGLTAGTTYYYLVEASDSAGNSAASNQASATTPAAGGGGGGTDVIAIDSGSTAAVGNFVADTDFNGGGTYASGQTVTVPAGLAGAAPAAVYQSARQGAFSYTIPGLAATSSYTVRLHFAELYFSAANSRQFNVAINGTQVLTNFDIVAAAGGKNFTAVVETFPNIVATGGQIVITFSNGAKDQPMINGVEVLTSTPPPTATSIDSGSTTAVGAFVADTDFNGGGTYAPGQTVTVPAGLANAAPAAVYQSARQGAFAYTIPGFANNSTGHTVTLHFAELYFSAAAQRQFNVSINGTQVLTNFDIFAAAGGKNFTAVVQSFPNITANGSGQIVITFANGAKDQPMINGVTAQ